MLTPVREREFVDSSMVAFKSDTDVIQYHSSNGFFHHKSQLRSRRPFVLVDVSIPFLAVSDEQHRIVLMLRKTVVPSGPYKGMTALVFAPASHFPFMKLPPELRQSIYKLVFPVMPEVSAKGYFPPMHYICDSTTGLRHPIGVPRDWLQRQSTALLRVNRAIYHEAREFLWLPQHFVVQSMSSAINFLRYHARYRPFLTRLTVRKSGHQLAVDFFKLLCNAPRLRELTVTMATQERKSLEDHVADHWEKLKIYVLADDVSYDEGLRRLEITKLDIGPATRGVLDDEGKPIREMTPELLDLSKQELKVQVRRHFGR